MEWQVLLLNALQSPTAMRHWRRFYKSRFTLALRRDQNGELPDHVIVACWRTLARRVPAYLYPFNYFVARKGLGNYDSRARQETFYMLMLEVLVSLRNRRHARHKLKTQSNIKPRRECPMLYTQDTIQYNEYGIRRYRIVERTWLSWLSIK